MKDNSQQRGLTRRELLSRSMAAGASFVVGGGYVASADAAWAMETAALKPETMATLIQMARDIYPHDHVGDEYYAIAVKAYDSEEAAPAIEAGIAGLNAAAQGKDVVDFDADKAIRVLEVTRPVYVDNDVLILRALTDAFFVWERAAFELE